MLPAIVEEGLRAGSLSASPSAVMLTISSSQSPDLRFIKFMPAPSPWSMSTDLPAKTQARKELLR